MNNISEREQWFLNRIGKRVWRNKTPRYFERCKQEYDKGIVILDTSHAVSLYHSEYEHNYYRFPSDLPVKYFDTPEERDAFELTLKK